MCNCFVETPLRVLRGRQNDQTASGWKIARDLLPCCLEGQHVTGEKRNVIKIGSSHHPWWSRQAILILHISIVLKAFLYKLVASIAFFAYSSLMCT